MSDRQSPWPPEDDLGEGPWEGYGSLDEPPPDAAARSRRPADGADGPSPTPRRPPSNYDDGTVGRSTQPIDPPAPAPTRRPIAEPDTPAWARPGQPAPTVAAPDPTAAGGSSFGAPLDEPPQWASRPAAADPTVAAPAPSPSPDRPQPDWARQDRGPSASSDAPGWGGPEAGAPAARPHPGGGPPRDDADAFAFDERFNRADGDADPTAFAPDDGGYDQAAYGGQGYDAEGYPTQGDYADGYADDGYADGYDDGYDDRYGEAQAYGEAQGDDPRAPSLGRNPLSSYADDEPPLQAGAAYTGDDTRRGRRDSRLRNRARAREARWEQSRFAVPYRTDGPKLTFGVLWFVAICGAIVISPLVAALLLAAVAALAGLQTGYAWFPRHSPTRNWLAGGAAAATLCGIIGPFGALMAFGVGLAVAVAYGTVNQSRSRSTMALVDVAVRSIVPVGVAGASIIALATISPWPALVLIGLVSTYEIGDFLIGSGSSNAVEGPITGLVGLAAVVFVLWVVTPPPFDSDSIVLFGALAGVCCPLGQLFASLILPRGASWAPALRRLDSYLVVAPLWMLLVASLPTGALGSG